MIQRTIKFGDSCFLVQGLTDSMGYPLVSDFLPFALMCSRSQPSHTGSLIVSRGDSQLGRFVLGNFYPSTPTPFVSRAMGDFVISSIRNSQSYQEHGSSYWHIYRDALEYILLEAGVRGHGGTIIVVPENKIAECTAGFDPRYKFTRSAADR